MLTKLLRDPVEQLRSAIESVLMGGVCAETKTEQLLHVFSVHQDAFSGVIIGWLEVRVREPEPGDLIDVRWEDGTVAFKRLCKADLLLQMRQRAALWKPAIL